MLLTAYLEISSSFPRLDTVDVSLSMSAHHLPSLLRVPLTALTLRIRPDSMRLATLVPVLLSLPRPVTHRLQTLRVYGVNMPFSARCLLDLIRGMPALVRLEVAGRLTNPSSPEQALAWLHAQIGQDRRVAVCLLPGIDREALQK